MIDTKSKLLSCYGFVDNDFLDRYVQLVERNRRTKDFPTKTNKHHIIPRSWYKMNGITVNDDLTNIVSLRYRDHVLAHYYLCLCTEDPLKYANELAFILLTSRKKLNISEKLLIHELPLYNNIYEDYVRKKQINYQLYGEK